MYFLIKYRVVDKLLRKQKIMESMKIETILTLESLEFIYYCYRLTYMGWKYISFGSFGQTF